MDKVKQFYKQVNESMTIVLATSKDNKITMRYVSPVLFNNDILIFTSCNSLKYQQLKENPNCGIYIKDFFVEAKATFYGNTMNEENRELRDVYNAKFMGAFEDNTDFGGVNKEFILLHPTRITGWGFENDIVTEDGVPTIPFDIKL